MSRVEAVREFVNRRLSAAAGEIFSVFLPTLVQYQEQIQTQQRLLQISRRETSKSQRTDNPQQHFVVEKKLRNKQPHSSLDQEEPEPPQIKGEQEEPESPRIEEVLLVVNQIADTVMVTVTDGQSEHGENLDSNNVERESIYQQLTAAAAEIFTMFQQTIVKYQEEIHAQQRLLVLQRIDDPQQKMKSSLEQRKQEAPQMKEKQEEPEDPQSEEEEEEPHSNQEEEQPVLKQEVDSLMMISPNEQSQLSEPDSEVFLFQDSFVAGSQHKKNIQNVDSRSTTKAGLKSNRRRQSKNVDNSPRPPQSSLSASMKIHTGEKAHSCETCGKKFRFQNILLHRMRIHTEEKQYLCKNCRKRFSRKRLLLHHMRIYTEEKQYLCKTCGESFSQKSLLLCHMRIHTREKLYLCETCGKRFSRKRLLLHHMRIHTEEKQYLCGTCGKSFSRKGLLLCHMRIQTREKLYSCETCGKRFNLKSNLLGHMRIHSGEKPYSCETW